MCVPPDSGERDALPHPIQLVNNRTGPGPMVWYEGRLETLWVTAHRYSNSANLGYGVFLELCLQKLDEQKEES